MNRKSFRSTAAMLAVAFLLIVAVVVFHRGDEASTDSSSVAEVDRPARGTRDEGERSGRPQPVKAITATAAIRVIRVHGAITDNATGKPISGAEVSLFGDRYDHFDTPALTVRSDGEGAYELTIDGRRGMNFTRANLTVTESRHESKSELLFNDPPANDDAIEKNFSLRAGGSITGIVSSSTGPRLGDVSVGLLVALKAPEHPIENPYLSFPETRTMSDGTFELSGLAADQEVRLYLQKRGFLPLFTEPLNVGARNVELTMKEGEAAINGYVQDFEGKPLKGVPVRAIMRAGGPGFLPPPAKFPDMDTQFTRSREDGFYEFPALNSGWNMILADLEKPMKQSIGETILFQKGDQKTLILRFKPMLKVNGLVVDEETNAPVSGVRIAKPGPVQPKENDVTASGGEVLSGPDGTFAIETAAYQEFGIYMVPAISYKLPGTYGSDSEIWQTQRVWEAAIERGEQVKILAHRTVLLEGTVFQSDDKSTASGVGVDFVEIGRGRMPEIPAKNPLDAKFVTGADGRFHLRVRPGSSGAALARTDKANVYAVVSVPPTGKPDDLRMVLKEFVSVAGTVTGPDGAPLKGIDITFFQLTNMNSLFGNENVTTDENGHYVREQLAAEATRIEAKQPLDSILIPPAPLTMNLVPGKNLTDVNFQFAEGAAFEGIVVNQSITPVEGVSVSRLRRGARGQGGGGMMSFLGGTAAPTLTDAAGHFKLVFPKDADSFSIQATHPAYDTKILNDLSLDGSPITITLSGREAVSLTAWKPDGAQLLDFEYLFAMERGAAAQGKRNAVGGKAFSRTEPVKEALSPGKYRVHIYELGGKQERTGGYGFANFEIAEGAPALEVKVQMGSELTLTGKVVDAEDKPINGVEVSMLSRTEISANRSERWGNGFGNRGGPQRLRTTTDREGAFAFEFTKPGHLTLQAVKEGFVTSDEIGVDVKDGVQPDPVVIKLVQGAMIFGGVIDQEGRAMHEVSLFLDNRRGAGTAVDTAGKYQFERVSPGDHTVMLVSKSGSEIARQEAKLENNARREVNFDLKGMIEVSGTLLRNGERDSSDYLAMQFNPTEGGGKSKSVVSAKGEYATWLLPGTYAVGIGDDRGASSTGASITVEPDPAKQDRDIKIELYSIGVVIVIPDSSTEFNGGGMTYFHRREKDAKRTQRTIGVRQKRFYIDNEPPGEARAVFTDRGGIKYSSDWTKITRNGENILTLLPDDLPK